MEREKETDQQKETNQQFRVHMNKSVQFLTTKPKNKMGKLSVLAHIINHYTQNFQR